MPTDDTLVGVERRFTFFVDTASRTPDGWDITGETGLGPIRDGDAFSFVFHRDTETEDSLVELRVSTDSGTQLSIVGGEELELREGDVLGGSAEE